MLCITKLCVVITLSFKFKKIEIRKIIFRSKWGYIKGGKAPYKIVPDRDAKISKDSDD
jgi:hypothetical protein